MKYRITIRKEPMDDKGLILSDAATEDYYSDMGDVSDGFHTFDELYEHRMALTLALMRSHPGISWVSLKHNSADTPIPEEFFIVGMDLPTGTITYHYQMRWWPIFENFRRLPEAPKWDGATPEDTTYRLADWEKPSTGWLTGKNHLIQE